MDPKFVRFIQFNGYLIATVICYHTFVQAFGLPPRLQQWYQCPGGQSWFGRDHPVVDGVLLLGWITAVASLYQALKLEVTAMLCPIGYLLSLEVALVVVQDAISTWNDDAEERYLRNAQDVLAWSVEDAEADEEDGQNGRSGDDRADRGDPNGEKEKLDEEHSLRDDGSPEPPNGEIVSILRKNGSLLQSQEISSSQQNFFRMLDQKIEEGPDYDSSSETEQALEEARLNALVQHWESASLTTSMCSSTSRSLQGTPVRQVPLRQPPLRPPFQQPLSAELLSQQQLLLKQQHHHLQQQQQQQMQQQQQQQLHSLQQSPQQQQQQSIIHQNLSLGMGMSSPKRVIGSGNAVSVGGDPGTQRSLLAQSLIHQNYGVIQTSQTATQLRPSSGRTLPSPVQCLQMSYYQQQQQQQQLQQQQQQQAQSLSQHFPQQQSIPPQSYYNDILRHPMQQQQLQSQPPPPPGISNVSSSVAASLASASVAVASAGGSGGASASANGASGSSAVSAALAGGSLTMSGEPRFPPAIAVQRLAPQVQRQLRETQELIKDSCAQLYGSAYGSPGPPVVTLPVAGGSSGPPLRTGPGSVLGRSAGRRPTLETQYSQELS